MVVVFFLNTPATRTLTQIELYFADRPVQRNEVLDELDCLLRGIETPRHRNPLIRDYLVRYLAVAKEENGLSQKRLRMELQ